MRSARFLGVTGLLAGLVLSAACNALTGADEPEIVEDDAVSAGPGLATSATTVGATASSGAAGGADDRDVATGAAVFPCGNGELGEAEECDDANVVPGDGCSDLCLLECGGGEAKRLPRGTCVSTSSADDDRTWDDAEAACQGRGASLMVLDDLDVSAFDGRLEDLQHVGARRADDGAFEWSDGSTVDEDVVVGDEEGHDCLALTLESEHEDGPLLRAVECDDRLPYLCERDPSAVD